MDPPISPIILKFSEFSKFCIQNAETPVCKCAYSVSFINVCVIMTACVYTPAISENVCDFKCVKFNTLRCH